VSILPHEAKALLVKLVKGKIARVFLLPHEAK